MYSVSVYLSIFICSITNHTAQQRERNNGTGRIRTAALRNRKMKKKVVTTTTSKYKTDNIHNTFACTYIVSHKQNI